jgi:salicylate hydroxylase
MALEDAYILSHLLGQCTNGESDITNAFAAYDSVRIPRTQDVVRASKEQGRVLDMQGKGSGDDLEKLAASLNIGVRWIWNEDLGKHRDAALDAFRRGKAETGLQVLSLEYKA